MGLGYECSTYVLSNPGDTPFNPHTSATGRVKSNKQPPDSGAYRNLGGTECLFADVRFSIQDIPLCGFIAA